MSRRLLIPLLLVCVLGASCSTLSVAAATVNGQKITETEVEDQLDVLRDDPVFGDALRTDPDERGRNRRAILSRLVYSAVAEQEAAKLGIHPTSGQIDTLLKQRADAENQTVKEFLDAQNLSNDQGRKIAEQLVRDFALQEKVLQGIQIDEADVRAQYDANKDAFVEAHLERITVKTQEEARKLLEDLEGKATFSELAEERSIDPAGQAGGDLGFIRTSSLSAEAQAAIASLDEGDVSDPIQAQAGFEVFHVLDKRTQPFEEAEADIRAGLLQTQQQQRYEGWLREQVLKARIVVNPKYGVFDKQQAQIVPAPVDLQP